MPLILGTNSIKDTGYDVANSLRFNDGSSDNLSDSQSTGNRRTWTFSTWVKRCTIGSSQVLINARTSDEDRIQFHSSNVIRVYFNGAASAFLVTNRLFRDVSAWYHIVVAVDTTQGTASNRIKLYVNGVQETSFSTETYPSQNYDTFFNLSNTLNIGTAYGGGEYMDGYMAEVVFIDGQQLDPNSFGEFDEDSSIWKPKDVSGLTFGTNGFYLDFENSGSLGADVSGNGNNFTVNNLTSIDQTTDTCTNNYATIDVLSTNLFDPATTVFSEGNLKHVAGTSANYNGLWRSNIGVNSGKWYAEFKLGSHSTTSGHSFGIYRENVGYNASGGNLPTSDLIRIVFADSSRYVQKFGTIVQTGLGSTSSGDIFGIYMDIDNGKLSVQKNGSDYITQITGMTTAGYTWFFHTQGEVAATRNLTFEHNYGNPSFSISSGNADPNGYGNFEFSTTHSSVDYYALNTKNLAEYG